MAWLAHRRGIEEPVDLVGRVVGVRADAQPAGRGALTTTPAARQRFTSDLRVGTAGSSATRCRTSRRRPRLLNTVQPGRRRPVAQVVGQREHALARRSSMPASSSSSRLAPRAVMPATLSVPPSQRPACGFRREVDRARSRAAPTTLFQPTPIGCSRSTHSRRT